MRTGGTFILADIHDFLLLRIDFDQTGVDLPDLGILLRLGPHIGLYKGEKVLDGTLASIQGKYSNDTIRLQTANEANILQNLPGVESVNDYGQMQELRITQNADTNLILESLLKKTKVQKFEIVKPSLHDIFIRIAGPEAKEAQNA